MRDAAAVAQCQNHLKQIVLAAHNYHEAHHGFPMGTLRGSADKVEDRLSLYVMLLPYLEQENLSKQIDHRQGWKVGTNQAATSVYIKTFQCPGGDRPVTEIVGMAGLGAEAATFASTHTSRGVFGYDRATTQKEIKDGTNETLMFIETTRDLGPWASGGPATLRGIDLKDRQIIGKDRAFGRFRVR